MAKKVLRQAKMHKHQLRIVYEPLSKLKQWELNPRFNDEAADKLCGLFDAHGFINPIIATPDGIIRAGHTRYKAALKAGFATVPVIYVPFESEAEAEMFALADNKSSEWATWNQELLAQLMGEERGIELGDLAKATGFQPQEIQGIRDTFGLPDAPPGIGDDQLPNGFTASELAGMENAVGRVIIVYYSEEERQQMERAFGVEIKGFGAGNRMVWKFAELKLKATAGVKKVKRVL